MNAVVNSLDKLKQRIIRVAETVTSEMPRTIWAEMIYLLGVFHSTKGDFVEIY
jgi:hypothetical protein